MQLLRVKTFGNVNTKHSFYSCFLAAFASDSAFPLASPKEEAKVGSNAWGVRILFQSNNYSRPTTRLLQLLSDHRIYHNSYIFSRVHARLYSSLCTLVGRSVRRSVITMFFYDFPALLLLPNRTRLFTALYPALFILLLISYVSLR